MQTILHIHVYDHHAHVHKYRHDTKVNLVFCEIVKQRNLPDRATERVEDRHCRNIFGFVESPVVRREGPSQRHLTERHDEVGTPEQHEELEGLQVQRVLVAAVLDERAHAPRRRVFLDRTSYGNSNSDVNQNNIFCVAFL